MNKNILGVEVPESISGLGNLKPFDGKRFSETANEMPNIKNPDQRMSKIVDNLETAIRLSGLKDGMTISFHHHFRNGDYIVNLVLDAVAKLGIKNLTIASSSLTDIHTPMIDHIKNGVVYRIETSGLRGELANQISHGLMEVPVVFRSHGGRAYSISSGELKIDVAFL